MTRFVTRFPVIITFFMVVAGALIPVDAFFTIMILAIWAGTTRDRFRGAFHVEIFAQFWAAWCTFTVYHICWTRYCCEQHCEKEKNIDLFCVYTCFSLFTPNPPERILGFTYCEVVLKNRFCNADRILLGFNFPANKTTNQKGT